MGVIENMKEVADLVKKVGDIDLNRKLVNLEGEVLDLTRDKRRLESKVEELEGILRLRKSLTFSEPFYAAERDEVPYCPSCWESKDKAVHLVVAFNTTTEGRWDCPSCKHIYLIRKQQVVQHQPIRW